MRAWSESRLEERIFVIVLNVRTLDVLRILSSHENGNPRKCVWSVRPTQPCRKADVFLVKVRCTMSILVSLMCVDSAVHSDRIKNCFPDQVQFMGESFMTKNGQLNHERLKACLNKCPPVVKMSEWVDKVRFVLTFCCPVEVHFRVTKGAFRNFVTWESLVSLTSCLHAYAYTHTRTHGVARFWARVAPSCAEK